jgi:curved DNA-binding protein CbpA
MPPFVRARLDCYAMLEIDRSADAAAINAAFRRLAWRYHPDRNPAPGSTLQFQDINEAHQVLSDPLRRAQYDAEWHRGVSAHRDTSRPAVRSYPRRALYRRRRFRTAVLAVCSVMFVSSAWALILNTIRSARPLLLDEISYTPSTVSVAASPDFGLRMEMFPLVYTDDQGRPATAWETDVRNWWGGSMTILSAPNLVVRRSANERQRPSERFGLMSH